MRAGSRLLPIYADDLALVANFPSHLQALIDALSDDCASADLGISATKTLVMQFLHLVYNHFLPVQHLPFWLRHSFLNISRHHFLL